MNDFKFNEVFSAKDLWFSYLPRQLLLPLGLIGLIIHFSSNLKLIVFFWLFLLPFFIGYSVRKYSLCHRKHDALIIEYGDTYIRKLEVELNYIGRAELIDRYWIGLEPDSDLT